MSKDILSERIKNKVCFDFAHWGMKTSELARRYRVTFLAVVRALRNEGLL